MGFKRSVQGIDLQTQIVCQAVASGSFSSQAFLIQKFSLVASQGAQLGGVLERVSVHFLVREHLCLLHRHSVHIHTHTQTQGSSNPLTRRCQQSTFCSVPDQTPGRGPLCRDMDAEDKSLVLHMASLGFWKT